MSNIPTQDSSDDTKTKRYNPIVAHKEYWDPNVDGKKIFIPYDNSSEANPVIFGHTHANYEIQFTAMEKRLASAEAEIVKHKQQIEKLEGRKAVNVSEQPLEKLLDDAIAATEQASREAEDPFGWDLSLESLKKAKAMSIKAIKDNKQKPITVVGVLCHKCNGSGLVWRTIDAGDVKYESHETCPVYLGDRMLHTHQEYLSLEEERDALLMVLKNIYTHSSGYVDIVAINDKTDEAKMQLRKEKNNGKGK